MKRRVFLILILLLALFLRIFKLGLNPPSLYWDEASLGYNAYLIGTSLHDEHGEFLPLSRFIAFGDYKPPGYIYAAVPSILVFGLNEFAIRFPSLLAGLLMVLVTYFLVKELLKNEKVAFLSSFLLAVSPWAIQFSRAAFEANLAALFNLLGIYLFIISSRKKWAILPSFLSFVFSFYTFNANRIIAPLIIIVLSLIYFKNIVKNLRWVLFSGFLSLFLVLLSFNYFTSRESKLRFEEVTIFKNLQPIETANARIALDGNVWWARVIHNRRVLFTIDYLKHYFDNFSGRFLFTYGDVNPRLAVQGMGQLYVWSLPFLLLGFYFLAKEKRKVFILLFSWMAISVIPAGTARETPHALRILSILPTYQIFIGFGVYKFSTWLKKSLSKKYYKILFFVLCSLFFVNVYYYLHIYHIHYPINWSGEWQYGYKQMVEYVADIEDNYDQIFVTRAYGRPYIYFAFYGEYSLDRFLKEKVADRDWFGFWTVKSLGKIRFGGYKRGKPSGRILVVTTQSEFPDNARLFKVIKNLGGDEVFYIGEIL